MSFQRDLFFFLVFVFIGVELFMLASGSFMGPQHSLRTDKDALLEFKKSVTIDPELVLSNWNDTTEVCRFNGISCKNGHRVRRIMLVGAGLVGRFSPVITNLTALRTINLSDNGLYGNIPSRISSLRHLRNLFLDNNNLEGPIPGSLSSLSNLTVLDLHSNRLSGEIPPSLFSNCTMLSNLDLSTNSFRGKIPVEIGSCLNLWQLNLYNNQFTGEIPMSLANASLMYNLDVENNSLSGELPSKLVSKLTTIVNIHLSYNQMVSHDQNSNLDIFFTALSNCSMLRELELAGMGLGGTIPDSISRLGINFSYLLLQENRIHGPIPPTITSLSRLIYLNLSMNHLNGTLSPDIMLPKLNKLWLSHNDFTGEIPEVIRQLHPLGELELSYNRFTGEIPESFGNLVGLELMAINNNQLSGKIPSSLGKCVSLNSLDLSYNRLTGKIPPQLLSALSLGNAIFLNLSHNHLEGPLPPELSTLATIKEINLSFNNLTGTIFPKISSYMALETLDLSRNSFQGPLPESLSKLTSLEVFDASNNSLSGRIPEDLSTILSLRFLNLSFNNFNGTVPKGGIFDLITSLSFLGNPHLCGHISGLRSCSHKKKYFRSPIFLTVFYVSVLVSILLTAVCCVIGLRRLKLILSSHTQTETESQPELPHNFPRITYKELAEATNGFDDQRLLGAGGFGRVYKGSLPDGTQIAVKVLQLQTGNSTRAFSRECQVLKRIRHRNLIRIITACSLPDFKALVLPFMGNGSLDRRLYPDSGLGLGSGSSDLNLIQRVNICSDIAEGMAYLHHHSPIKVIHCDLKPSNVLLNDDMTALVSDFGIAKLVMTIGAGSENLGNSTANMLCGSIGYIAPEYGFGSNPSTVGDVYSFGILVLEMVTRKRPTDDMFSDGLSLHKWVKSHYHSHMDHVVDSSLLRRSRNEPTDVKKVWEVAIGELLEMGILCTQDSPANRPTMMDVADDLDRLKRYLNGDTTATFASSLGISSSTMSDD